MLLAAFLAIWSPALCCCDLKVAMGRMTGVAAAGCGAAACCVERANSQPVSCYAVAEDEQGCDSPQPPCRCHEQATVEVKLNTGAKASVLGLGINLHQTVLNVKPALPSSHKVAAMLRDDYWQRAHGPPDTLVAKRCLLLM